jgi:hypothetical protein
MKERNMTFLETLKPKIEHFAWEKLMLLPLIDY